MHVEKLVTAFYFFTVIVCFYLAATADTVLVPLLALSAIVNMWFFIAPLMIMEGVVSLSAEPPITQIDNGEMSKDPAAVPVLFDDIIGPYMDDMNDATAIMSRSRDLDRRSLKARAAMSVDDYRQYFGSEMDENETKVWWGNNDI